MVLKEHPVKTVLASLFILSVVTLQLWNSYAPVSTRERNKGELSRIKVADPKDFTFAVMGDNKGNSSVFEPLLRDIDHRTEIAFAIDLGDLVNGGKRGHYRRFLKQLQEYLAIPLLTAIGNHDLNGRSSKDYESVFGPTYYAFKIGEAYFIVLDATTESGFDKTEQDWLEHELQKSQTSEVRFVFMHVPPFDPRGSGFNKCLPERDGKDLLDLFRRYNVTHLFASHIHGYFCGDWEGVPYTITGGAGARLQGTTPNHFFHHYVQVRIHNRKVEMEVQRVDGEGVIARLFDLIEDYVPEWGLLLAAAIILLVLVLSIRSKNGEKSL